MRDSVLMHVVGFIVSLAASWSLSARAQPPNAEEPPRENYRRPADEQQLKFWLENMVRYHRFSVAEVEAATGLTADQIEEGIRKLDIRPDPGSPKPPDQPLRVLPYPGGRHPRIGFLEGAIRPQRETKVSVFAPWNQHEYVVLDVPEAIRWDQEGERGLLYLAHTHVPTIWTKTGQRLEPLEWQEDGEGGWRVERRLPNGVRFGTRVMPRATEVRLEMWLTNGSTETLGGLRVQNCVMLKGVPSMAAQTGERTLLAQPFAARRSQTGDRWVITAWQRCQRAWTNPPCPCLHSDPQFPDCAPGQTERLRGWLSFYEGPDIQAEFRRIHELGWLSDRNGSADM
jgi:hypothetical protein